MTERSWLALAIAAAITAIASARPPTAPASTGPTSGRASSPTTIVEILLTLGGGVLVALAAALEPAGRMRLSGAAAATALLALAAFTALSIGWSVAPSNSWLEANRTLAYAATFAGAIALVRLAGARWRSVLAGVLLATATVSIYAVASKIIPETLDAGGTTARLQVPLYYWNAVGLTAALGIPPALWLGARREGHGVLNALAAPALCVLAVTLVLSYSRGAILAALVGIALWLALVPLRLRGARAARNRRRRRRRRPRLDPEAARALGRPRGARRPQPRRAPPGAAAARRAGARASALRSCCASPPTGAR